MTETIGAVIVAHERPRLLRRCVDLVMSQTRKPDRLIVVDNASGPESKAVLDELESSGVEVTRLESNLGSAGGFASGMTLAMDQSCDWVWLLDDDGQPDSSALEKLLAKAKSRGLGVAGPLVVNERFPEKLAFSIGRIETTERAVRAATGGILADFVNAYNGTLVSRTAIDGIGLPKLELFIWGDEYEYIQRAKKHGIAVGTVVDARYRHPPPRGELVPIFGGVFGRVMVKSRGMVHVFARNQGYLDRQYRGGLGTLRTVATYAYVYLFHFKGDLEGYRHFLRYYFDGYSRAFRLPR